MHRTCLNGSIINVYFTTALNLSNTIISFSRKRMPIFIVDFWQFSVFLHNFLLQTKTFAFSSFCSVGFHAININFASLLSAKFNFKLKPARFERSQNFRIVYAIRRVFRLSNWLKSAFHPAESVPSNCSEAERWKWGKSSITNSAFTLRIQSQNCIVLLKIRCYSTKTCLNYSRPNRLDGYSTNSPANCSLLAGLSKTPNNSQENPFIWLPP